MTVLEVKGFNRGFKMRDTKIKVLIVDDSALVRVIMARELSKDGELDVIGTTNDIEDAKDKILELKPDLLVLDFNMPGVDSLVFLRNLMKYHPIPVIVISTPSPIHAIEARRAGAVDLLFGPQSPAEVKDITCLLIKKIKEAYRNHTMIPILQRQMSNIPDIYKRLAIFVFEDEVKKAIGVGFSIPLNKQGAFFASNVANLDTIQKVMLKNETDEFHDQMDLNGEDKM